MRFCWWLVAMVIRENPRAESKERMEIDTAGCRAATENEEQVKNRKDG